MVALTQLAACSTDHPSWDETVDAAGPTTKPSISATPFTPIPPTRDALALAEQQCRRLVVLLEAQDDGFAWPSARRIASNARDEPILEAFSQCAIEGRTIHSKRVICHSASHAEAEGPVVIDAFATAASQIQVCLDQPIWFPREWRRGELMQFARNERLQFWQDITSTPRSLVTLKLDSLPDRSLTLRLEISRM